MGKKKIVGSQESVGIGPTYIDRIYNEGGPEGKENLDKVITRLQLISEYTNDLIIFIKADQTFLYANQIVLKYFSISPENILGKKLDELDLPEYLVEKMNSTIHQIFESGGSKRIELAFPNSQWLDMEFIPVLARNGSVNGVFASGHDVTIMKRKLLDLEKSEKNLKEAQIMAQLGYWTWDIKSGDVEWSEETYKIFRLDPESFKPHINSILDLSPWPEDHNRNKELIAKAIESHEQGVYEQKFLRPDKSIGYYLSTFQGYYDEEGDLITMKGVVQDISERKQAEKALKDSEEKYLTFSKKSHDAILMLRDGLIVDCNSAALKVLRYNDLNEVLNFSPVDLSPEYQPNGQKSADMAAEMLAITYKEGVSRFEWENITKDGVPLPVDVSLTEIPPKEEKVVIAVLRDLTQNKKVEKDRKRLEEQLRQSQKMEAVGHLAGGIAHDFNNLLTPIIGNADMILLKLKPDDSVYEEIKEIKETAISAGELVKQLLAFGRKQILDVKEVDLNQVVLRFSKILRSTIRESIKFEMELSSSGGLVKVDISQVEQILMNLFVNAQDAMPKGGTITLETEHVYLDRGYAKKHSGVIPGNYIQMTVSDTGTGMSIETQENIFNPFFTTKEEGKGTGLGLSTIYGIVKQHRGYIWVYSELGKGTTFKIYLPLIEGKGIDIEKIESETSEYTGKETILVVEDQEQVRRVVEKILKLHHFNVYAAADPEEAISIVQDQNIHIDLLLTDVIMPIMNGRELYSVLNKVCPDLKVLYMSGYTKNVIVHHGIKDKDIELIQKPLTVNNLLKKVRKVLSC